MNLFFIRMTGWIGLFLLAVLIVSGCVSSNKPASASFAGVIISNYTPQEIRTATDTVFQQNGYQAMGEQGGALVYERQATEREQRQYAGFVGAHEGEKVNIRVRVKIEANHPSPNSYWLTCKAYAVLNPGQGVFETVTALFDFQSGPYEKLLDKVKGTVALPAVKS
jgi:hypothetical protein